MHELVDVDLRAAGDDGLSQLVNRDLSVLVVVFVVHGLQEGLSGSLEPVLANPVPVGLVDWHGGNGVVGVDSSSCCVDSMACGGGGISVAALLAEADGLG